MAHWLCTLVLVVNHKPSSAQQQNRSSKNFLLSSYPQVLVVQHVYGDALTRLNLSRPAHHEDHRLLSEEKATSHQS